MLSLLLCVKSNEPSHNTDSSSDADTNGYFYQDKSDWVDPGDMFTYDAARKRNSNSRNKMIQTDAECQCPPTQCSLAEKNKLEDKLRDCQRNLSAFKSLSKTRPGCDQRADAFFRRFHNKAVSKLIQLKNEANSMASSVLFLQIGLTRGDLDTLDMAGIRTSIESQLNDCKKAGDIAETMISLLDSFEIVGKETLFEKYCHYIPIIFGLLAISYIIFSIRRNLFLLFLFALLTCTVWQWFRLYFEVVAKRQDTIHMPAECIGGKSDVSSTIKSIFGYLYQSVDSKISFNSKYESSCSKYYRDVIVSPILEVNPVEAFVEVIAILFFRPLALLGDNFGLSFSNFFQHIPIVQLIWVAPMFLIIALCSLLILGRYSLNLPFISLKPERISYVKVNDSPSTNLPVENRWQDRSRPRERCVGDGTHLTLKLRKRHESL